MGVVMEDMRVVGVTEEDKGQSKMEMDDPLC